MNLFLLKSGSFADNPLNQAINSAMGKLCPIQIVDDCIRVTTQCLYPSNGLVRVFVRNGVQSVLVSDDGEAVGEAFAAGIDFDNPDRLLRSFVRERGLLINKGCLHTNLMPIEDVSLGIIQVANAARDVATWLYEKGGIKHRNDFRQLLAAFLANTFREQVSETHIFGASHKQHNFKNVISFANGKRLIVDAVSNDVSSINARVVANLDVKSMNDHMIEQRIIYDDNEKWSSSDLSLLQVGATIVPFSQHKEVINRVAEQTRSVAS